MAIGASIGRQGMSLEQFQEKCVAVFRPELRKDKRIERFRDSEKNGKALRANAIGNRGRQVCGNAPSLRLGADPGFSHGDPSA
ncbi:hypothetical protein FP026_02005 [Rhizobium tropici]|uniref:Uncharacterized protein n=1 Tax=Rhizobium tropici TaxID=398 RepID=A0A5B0WGI0_RHITR|nr:hypothetical protein FP026_02005 [Rhizobium tropici]